MKIYYETPLRNFRARSGAAENFGRLNVDQKDYLEAILENLYPDGIDETELNDLLWFDMLTVAEWLGLAVDRGEQLWYNYDELDEAEAVACAWFSKLDEAEACELMGADTLEEAAESWAGLDLEEMWDYYTAR